ncbi:MAG: hypothetical protein FWG89_05830 [Treponema sp.]|nr:hypothetical protein [Treponema sp.]
MAKKQASPEEFWRELEAKTGEKVLARSLGQYVSGWEEFDRKPGNPPGTGGQGFPLWGLIIATSGGFRFHHFPQVNWLTTLARFGSPDGLPQEKTIFIPRDNILSAVLYKETKWYKKIFSSAPPRLEICYRDAAETEKKLILNAEYKTDGIAEALVPLPLA